jgi:hypothetical protein
MKRFYLILAALITFSLACGYAQVIATSEPLQPETLGQSEIPVNIVEAQDTPQPDLPAPEVYLAID